MSSTGKEKSLECVNTAHTFSMIGIRRSNLSSPMNLQEFTLYKFIINFKPT